MKLKIDSIQTEAGTQTRVKINEDAVTEYAEAMENGAEFPPVTVFHDGTDYWMADGFHRIMAASRNGFVDIEAEVRAPVRMRSSMRLGPTRQTAAAHQRRKAPLRHDRTGRISSDWTTGVAEVREAINLSVVRSELQLCDSHSCQTLKRIGRAARVTMPTPFESRGWTAAEVASPKHEDPTPKVTKWRISRRRAHALSHAENAIAQLEKYQSGTPLCSALESVARWIVVNGGIS